MHPRFNHPKNIALHLAGYEVLDEAVKKNSALIMSLEDKDTPKTIIRKFQNLYDNCSSEKMYYAGKTGKYKKLEELKPNECRGPVDRKDSECDRFLIGNFIYNIALNEIQIWDFLTRIKDTNECDQIIQQYKLDSNEFSAAAKFVKTAWEKAKTFYSSDKKPESHPIALQYFRETQALLEELKNIEAHIDEMELYIEPASSQDEEDEKEKAERPQEKQSSPTKRKTTATPTSPLKIKRLKLDAKTLPTEKAHAEDKKKVEKDLAEKTTPKELQPDAPNHPATTHALTLLTMSAAGAPFSSAEKNTGEKDHKNQDDDHQKYRKLINEQRMDIRSSLLPLQEQDPAISLIYIQKALAIRDNIPEQFRTQRDTMDLVDNGTKEDFAIDQEKFHYNLMIKSLLRIKAGIAAKHAASLSNQATNDTQSTPAPKLK